VENALCYTEYRKMGGLASRTSAMKDRFWPEKVHVNTVRPIPELVRLATNAFLINARRMNLFSLMAHARSVLVTQERSKIPCVFLTSAYQIKDCC
jgi:hypothetical protein